MYLVGRTAAGAAVSLRRGTPPDRRVRATAARITDSVICKRTGADEAVSTLEVTFPDEWLTLPMQAAGGVTPLLPTLDELHFDARASLALLDECEGVPVRAFCAVGVVPGSDEESVRVVAEGGPHPGLERDTVKVQLTAGAGVRSAAFRFVPELLDDPSIAPYAAEVRFAFPLPGRRIGVLHFETLSLGCFEQLDDLFDLIAGTARVA